MTYFDEEYIKLLKRILKEGEEVENIYIQNKQKMLKNNIGGNHLMKKFLKEFKEFINRGNVMDMASKF